MARQMKFTGATVAYKILRHNADAAGDFAPKIAEVI